MRKLFSTLSAILLLSVASQAQIVINEVMYNIPGAVNPEPEEFIELYNAGGSAVNMQGYTFTQGVAFTFGNVSIPAGGYYVIAYDSTAFNNCFGMFPNAIFSGALTNGGEDITIYDNLGNLVDSIDYKTGAPWPVVANTGRSIQLCSPTTDNGLGSNWGITNTGAGRVSNGIDSVYATPGAMNVCVTFVPPPPPSYPLYTFGQVDNVNGTGLADSANVTCELRGVAHCVDLRGGAGYDFPFANSNNSAGIRVFSNTDVNNYTVLAGDSLHIKGKVQQFNGLLQFIPDSIMVISQGNAMAMPMTVTTLSENTENRLVRLMNMHVADTSEWMTGTGTGFNVMVTSGSTDTILVRIDNDVDLFNQPAPLGTFSITGWGAQFDTSDPRTEGYQLMPCGMSMVVGTTELENNSHQVLIYPNPVSGSLNINSDIEIESILIYNTLGQQVIAINNVRSNTTQVNTSNLENGVYVINVVTGKKMMTKQFQVVK